MASTPAGSILDVLASVLATSPDALVLANSFVSHGGDSMTALRFSAECKRMGTFIPVDAVLSSPTLEELIQKWHQNPLSASLCKTKAMGLEITTQEIERDNSSRASTPSSPSLHPSLSAESLSSRSSQVAASTRPSSPTFPSRHSITAKANLPPVRPSEAQIDTNDDFILVSTETTHLCRPQDLAAADHSASELSEAQISLVHGSIEVPGSNIISYYEPCHPDQVPRKKEAWKQVLMKEPMFRTIYRSPEANGCLLLPMFHWREFTTTNPAAYRDAASKVPDGDDLSRLPHWSDLDPSTTSLDLSVRFTVVHYLSGTCGSRSTIIWHIHHALIDGWSASLVFEKVRAVMAGEPIESGHSYTNFCVTLEKFRQAHKEEGDAFWAQQEEKLVTAQDELLLPAPPMTVAKSTSTSQVDLTLGQQQYEDLKRTASAVGVTPAAFFHASLALCLGLYTDSDNIMVGTVVSGRNLNLPGVLEVIGPMVNTLPLQIDITWNVTASAFLKDVFNRMQRLSEYAWTTTANGAPRVKGPLIAMQPDVQHLKQNVASTDEGEQPFTRQTTNLPLNVVVTDRGDVQIQYSPQRYTQNQIETVASYFRDILLNLYRSPENTLSACVAGIMSTEEVATLRRFGNCHSALTTRSAITDDLVTLFERAASEHPQAVALDQGDLLVTYAELETRSGRIARRLQGMIQSGEVVAVHADGSINWIIAIYAVLRAGGVYFPLDKAHPQAYRDQLFEASTARYYLAPNKLAASPQVTPQGALLGLDVDSMLLQDCGKGQGAVGIPLRQNPRPWDRSYLCFTSGSTGEPKGVMCTHEGLVAFQRDFDVRLRAEVGVRVAQIMSVAFDGSIHELFSALSYGATLVLRGGEKGFGHLKSADSAILTPSVASVLDPHDFPQLKTVYLVGEAVPQAVCNTWAAVKTLYNMYGPTEATCGATIKRLRPNQPVTIGGPNPSTRIYVLDHKRRLAPLGRIGEVYLAGVQVAQGYIGRPELSSTRFFPDAFVSGLGEFMYKTGDRGYWNEAGEIVFLGRADRQIKFHGFRVDLEELEARILVACSEVLADNKARAVAVTRKDDDLVCLIQTTATVQSDRDLGKIKDAIYKAVPAYAVPKYVSTATSLPVTSTGKVDYKAVATTSSVANPLQPSEDVLDTETETVVAATWSQVLNCDPQIKIGPHSNFMYLGGHSLQQLRLASKLSAIFGERITVRMITELPTLRDLAAAIDKMRGKAAVPVDGASGDSLRALITGGADKQVVPSPMEQEWWYKYQLDLGSSAFNVSYVAQFNRGTIESGRLVRAWNEVLSRHDAFRYRYTHSRRHGVQRRLSSCSPWVIKQEDVEADIWMELNKPFDLATSPPVRVSISKNIIVAVFSHIICDYTTLSIILSEVTGIYHGESLPPPLPSPLSQRRFTPPPPCHLKFWSEYLDIPESPPPNYLSTGQERTSYRGTSLCTKLSPTLWHEAQALASRLDITLQQLVLGAVALAVTADSDAAGGITLGVPFINRHSEVEMQSVGLFLEPLPVRIGLPHSRAEPGDAATTTTDEYLKAVQVSSQRALSHAIPWHQLLEHLDIDITKVLPNHPLFDCVVSFHDTRHHIDSVTTTFTDDEIQERGHHRQHGPWGSGLDGMEPKLVWSEGSKFKLMVEWIALSDDALVLRLEYDSALFSPRRIAVVRGMILWVLQQLISTGSPDRMSVEQLREEARETWSQEQSAEFTGDAANSARNEQFIREEEKSGKVGFGEMISNLVAGCHWQ
ncbi:hypothetical protein QBC35DRAFT_517514 [Podospora australis]|uniref:Carrier domain-containing protein n=1 Tax=Podospora australis TaxID=1536484 RepID=A0AAN7ADF2_9PEZI|nr:hypothetical protein QBC35DRAFT_517514 [Podospora australis]